MSILGTLILENFTIQYNAVYDLIAEEMRVQYLVIDSISGKSGYVDCSLESFEAATVMTALGSECRWGASIEFYEAVEKEANQAMPSDSELRWIP